MSRFSIAILLVTFVSCGQRKIVERAVSPEDTNIQKMITKIGDTFRSRPRTMAIYLDSIKLYLDSVNHPALTSAWLAYKGMAFALEGNKDSTKAYLNKSITVGSIDTSGKALIVPRIQVVTYLVQQHKYDSALLAALENYEIAKINRHEELPVIHSQLSYLYQVAGDSTNYVKYLYEGLRNSEKPTHLSYFYADLGRFFASRNEIDSADYYYQQYQKLNVSPTPYGEARKYEEQAIASFKQGRPLDGINNYLNAIYFFKKAGLVRSGDYYKVGRAYQRLGETRKGDLYIDSALHFARLMNEQVNVSNILFYKSTILFSQKQFEKAYQALDSSYIYHLAYDSTNFKKSIEAIESKMTTKAQEAKLAALQFEMNATQKINRQRQFIIVALIVGILAIVSLGITLFRRRQMKLEMREAGFQQQLLRRQMEPHFVFNSLSVLQSFIRNGSQDKSIDYLSKFSRLLRFSLENTRHSFIPLTEEVAALISYLDLQALRTDHSFEYQIEVEEGLNASEILIPPMVLQPFAENAIYHGFSNIDYKGKLQFSLSNGNGVIQCIIVDNGIGLQMQRESNKRRSHSTEITRERLALISRQTGKKSKLVVTEKGTAEGTGVRVVIEIPYLQ